MTCVYSDPRWIHDRPKALTDFADLVLKVAGSIGRWRRQGRAFRAIGSLSDTALNDLGFQRAEILSHVRGATGELRRQEP